MMEKMDKKSPLALLARACETIGADNSYNSNNGKTSSDSNASSSTPLISNGMASAKKLSTSASAKIHQPQKLNGHHHNQHHNHLHNGISVSNCHSPAQDTNSNEITPENNTTPKSSKKENGNHRKSPRETANEMHSVFNCEPSTSSPSGAFSINGGMFNGLGSFPPGTNPANFMRPGPSGMPFPMPPGNAAGQPLYPLNLMMAMAAAQQSQMMMPNPAMLQQLQHHQFAQMAQQQAVAAAAAAAAAAGKTASHAAQTSTTASASAAPIPATQQQHRAPTPPGQKKSNSGIITSSSNGPSATSSSNLTNNSQIGAHLAALAAATGVNGMDELAAAAFAQQQINLFNAQYAAATSNTQGLPPSSETAAAVAAAGFPPINPFAMLGNGTGLDNSPLAVPLQNLSAAAPSNTFQAMVMAAACGQGRQICTYDVKGQICGKVIDGETDLIAHLKAHIVQNGGVIPSPKESIQNAKTNGGGKIKSSTKPQTSPQQQISYLGTPIPAHFPQQQLPALPPQASGSANSLRYTPYARTSQQQHQQQQQQQQQTMAAIQQMHAAALQQTHQQQQQQQNQKQQQSSGGQHNQQNQAAAAAANGMLAMQYEQILAAMAGIPGAAPTPFPGMAQPHFFPPQSQAQAVTPQSAQSTSQRQQQQQQVQLNAHHQHQQMMHQQQLIMQHQQQQHQAAAVIAAAVGSGDK